MSRPRPSRRVHRSVAITFGRDHQRRPAVNTSDGIQPQHAHQRHHAICDRTHPHGKTGSEVVPSSWQPTIEEFARHAGHGDILREQIDKATL
ncbi:DinB family protein [Nocardia sp. NBC_01730]|uniref:mycothiol transferase n=1 Tax=Nocardia sp. NBC_01730 TaxID=2975998 RepID=UPI002E104A7F|nr:DinB family protein [Nocardia sp. NBC_01730]